MRGVFPSVPKVVGRTAFAARLILSRRGLSRFTPSFQPNGRVVAQSPKPGASAKVYAVVKLTVATG